GRLSIAFEPMDLLERRLNLTEITLERPEARLEPGRSGKPNWQLALPAGTGEPPPLAVELGQLVIRQGRVRLIDPKLKSNLDLVVATTEARDGKSQIAVDGKGTYA